MKHLVGKIVRFLPSIEDMEGYAEPEMMARIVGIKEKDTNSPSLHDHLYEITFDFTEFEGHNLSFESANYYDKNGVPCLTARQANFYEPKETVYFGSPLLWPFEKYFEVIDGEAKKLVDEFLASGSESYIQWLEMQLINARGEK